MSNQKILVIEDDVSISKLIRYNLEKSGFMVETTITGEEALVILDREEIHLVILDIMLPKMDGLETCKRIKQDKSLANIPVLILTAKGEEIDRIVGFELGADDYMVKPFSPRELVLRVKAILKRFKPVPVNKEIFEADNLYVDISRHKVKVDGQTIKLTSMEFNLLVTLLKRRGRVQSRDQLLNDVWNLDAEVTTRTIDTHVKRLRQKLGSAGNLIETVRGFGYLLKEED